MGFIYKVTNTVNGKVYIGQTCRSIQERWREHIRDSFGDSKRCKFAFHRAIRKYGENAFSVEQVEECPKSELDEHERYWIKYYGSYSSGYNADFGGRSYRGHPVYQYTTDGIFVRKFESIGEAQESIGKVIMINNINPNVTAGGYLWRRYKVDKLDVDCHKQKKTVYQYSLDGDYIGEYSSLTEAARAVWGRNTGSQIGAVCRGDGQCVYGYRWSFKKVDRLDPIRPSKYVRKVIRISKDTGEETVYSSIKDAAKDNNVSATSITAVCKGKAKTCGGYLWKYYDMQDTEKCN